MTELRIIAALVEGAAYRASWTLLAIVAALTFVGAVILVR